MVAKVRKTGGARTAAVPGLTASPRRMKLKSPSIVAACRRKPVSRDVRTEGIIPKSSGQLMARALSGPLVCMSIERQTIGSLKALRAVTVHCASSGLRAVGTLRK